GSPAAEPSVLTGVVGSAGAEDGAGVTARPPRPGLVELLERRGFPEPPRLGRGILCWERARAVVVRVQAHPVVRHAGCVPLTKTGKPPQGHEVTAPCGGRMSNRRPAAPGYSPCRTGSGVLQERDAEHARLGHRK